MNALPAPGESAPGPGGPVPGVALRGGPARRWTFHARSTALLGFMMLVLFLALRQGTIETPTRTLVGLAALAWLPLTLRDRFALVALSGACLAEGVHLLLLQVSPDIAPGTGMSAFQPVPLATMVAAWSYARVAPPRRAWAAGLGAGMVLAVIGVVSQPLNLLATDITVVNLVAVATAAGAASRARRERAARVAAERQQEVRREVQQERMRIARELHDVLAHHLTLVNAQAGVAEYLLRTDTDAAETALRGISQHTRQALDEVRATVGLLRHQDDIGDPRSRTTVEGISLPSLADLGGLVAGALATGQPAQLVVQGTPRPVDAAVDLAGYRIVQEALTNAARHSPGGAVEVHVTWSPATVELAVDNEPASTPAVRRHGGGHGLLGMRERAAAAGGNVTAGPRSDGGFRVRATLPTRMSTVTADSTS